MTSAVTSPVGVARLLQMTFGCTTFSLVAHQGGFSAAYGTFCMFVWTFCFAITVFIIGCEFTRLHSCLHISWGNFTAAFAMLATLMCATAAVIYPLYFVQLGCYPIGSPRRPALCAKGRCPWDSQLVIAIFTYVNLLLYVADLAYSQRIRFVSHL
ncbi:PREDICTED: myeloid-associated differentiation marker-like protein 2 [Tinamus guttatus]|uniref:myeloid-associated differentiation marker-like protein 2 n=1 Tax=Tinamus guttatus TaxID=94827 RepID=UPI00052E8156|nr:PREDICTED: myeloid-associated differentiation marker-like protein 2 [Tinamus guttatus]